MIARTSLIALDHVLGVLEAQARDRAHFLDDRDLVRTGGLEDHVELRLLLGGSGGGGRAGHGDGGGGGNAPRLFERLHEFVDFENGLARQFLDDFFVRHCLFPFLLVNLQRFSSEGNLFVFPDFPESPEFPDFPDS